LVKDRLIRLGQDEERRPNDRLGEYRRRFSFAAGRLPLCAAHDVCTAVDAATARDLRRPDAFADDISSERRVHLMASGVAASILSFHPLLNVLQCAVPKRLRGSQIRTGSLGASTPNRSCAPDFGRRSLLSTCPASGAGVRPCGA
jgi:hypothetical protein